MAMVVIGGKAAACRAGSPAQPTSQGPVADALGSGGCGVCSAFSEPMGVVQAALVHDVNEGLLAAWGPAPYAPSPSEVGA